MNPRPTLLREGFSGRSPRRPYSASPVMRTCWCDRPSRCLLSLKIPRPDPSVILLAGARIRGGETPGLTDSLLAQAARAKSAGFLAAFIFLQRMVNEIIVAFLGPLHLTRQTLSRPITPEGTSSYTSITSQPARDLPGWPQQHHHVGQPGWPGTRTPIASTRFCLPSVHMVAVG